MIGTNIGRKIAIALAALVAVVGVIYVVSRVRPERGRAPGEAEKVSGEARSATIYFGRAGADGFATETREVPAGQSLESEVKAVVGELIAGSTDSKKVNTMPQGAELRQVFWVEDSQMLILDFNRALADNHPGGSAGEYFTIGSILKTISANFPQVAKVQFLIEGASVESLAGHYAIEAPIDVKKWR